MLDALPQEAPEAVKDLGPDFAVSYFPSRIFQMVDLRVAQVHKGLFLVHYIAVHHLRQLQRLLSVLASAVRSIG